MKIKGVGLASKSNTLESLLQQLITDHVGRGEQDEDFEVRKSPRERRSEQINRWDDVGKEAEICVENGGVGVGTCAHLFEGKMAL